MKVPVISERARPYILVGHDASGWRVGGQIWAWVEIGPMWTCGQVNVRHQARPDRPIAGS